MPVPVPGANPTLRISYILGLLLEKLPRDKTSQGNSLIDAEARQQGPLGGRGGARFETGFVGLISFRCLVFDMRYRKPIC